MLTSYYRDLYALDIYNQNLIAAQPIKLEDSNRIPGLTEELVIKAAPVTNQDIVAVVRLSFDNAEVIEVEPLQALTFGACENGALYTSTSICADIATTEYFKQGDPLLKATIKWGSKGQSLITAGVENGYYDGFNLNNNMLNMAVDINGILPLTGEETKQALENDQSLTVFLLIAGGFLVVLVILILVTRSHPIFNRIPVYYSIVSILALSGLAVFIGNNVDNKEQTPVASLAAPPSYVTCPAAYQKSCYVVGDTTWDNQHCDGNMAYKCMIDGTTKCSLCAGCAFELTYPVWSVACSDPAVSTDLCVKNGIIDGDNHCAPGNKAEFGCDKYKEKASSRKVCDSDEVCQEGQGCISTNPAENNYCEMYKWTSGVHCPTNDPFQVTCSFIPQSDTYVQTRTDCDEVCDTGYGCDPKPNSCSGIFSRYTGTGLYCFSKWQLYCEDVTGTVNVRLLNSLEFDSKAECLDSCAHAAECKEDVDPIVDPSIDPPIDDDDDDDEEEEDDTDKCAQIPAADWDKKGYYCSPVSGESKVLLYCNEDKTEDKSKSQTCSANCVKELPGTNDHCPSAPTGTAGPTNTAQPTDTAKPTDTVKPTVTPETGIYQCGQKGCTNDNQCEIGMPNYECDESEDESKWPQENICVRLCPAGTTQTGPCTCSSDAEKLSCGPIDVNGDGILNYIDLGPFSRVYNKGCSDTPYQGSACGGKDTNEDTKINFADLGYFSSNYYPKKLQCN